jgi:kynurenine 3-monooxygenase
VLYFYGMGKPVIICGAGLCGSLLAIRLAQRGHQVELFESRPDLRKTDISAGRSINLALSNRGLKALRMVGAEEEVRRELIPMHGRMIHHLDGSTHYQPYSGREHDYINSVSRGGLNMTLLDQAERMPNIRMHFNHVCTSADLERGIARFETPGKGHSLEIEGEVIIGTDGANSAVRQTMLSQAARLRFDFSVQWLSHGYRELIFPPTPDGDYAIEKHALHIWPRGGFMMIALPNPGGSFTVTLFLPFEGETGFEAMTDGPSVRAYFNKWFADSLDLAPGLEQLYFEYPLSSLGTVRCYPWTAFGRSLLLGDAAHAIVPFYGQGMNCALEDCVVLDECLDMYEGRWADVFAAVQEKRKPNADAIADLAIENFYEMRDHVANPVFMRKRQLETLLEKRFPRYYSKYSLVTFREDVPYKTARELGNAQDAVLMALCDNDTPIEAMDLEQVLLTLEQKTAGIRP